MSHPLVPSIYALAAEIAPSLGLELVGVSLQTHSDPAIVRVDIRNLADDTGLNDCERMSLALEAKLDETDVIPFPYTLEVSSPGIDRYLSTDREFIAFRGFTITVTTHAPHAGKQTWVGQLVERNETNLTLTQRGKLIQIPRSLIATVELQ